MAKFYTAEEDKIILDESLTNKQRSELLPNRTITSIKNRRNLLLGGNEIREQRREYFKNYKQTERGKIITLTTNRKANKNYYHTTQNAVNSHRRYSKYEDIIILSKQYSEITIAEKLGRSLEAIQLRRLRLKQGIVSTELTEKQIQMLGGYSNE